MTQEQEEAMTELHTGPKRLPKYRKRLSATQRLQLGSRKHLITQGTWFPMVELGTGSWYIKPLGKKRL